MISIETDRLLLRSFTIHDVEAAYQMNLDPEITRYTGDGGVVSREEMERRIVQDVIGDYERHGFGRFAVEWKENQTFIGFAGLKYLPDVKKVDLGYRFLQSYWGQGIATEASQACIQFGFDQLQLQEIVAFIIPENAASLRVLEKLQFRFDGMLIEDGMEIHAYIRQKSSN